MDSAAHYRTIARVVKGAASRSKAKSVETAGVGLAIIASFAALLLIVRGSHGLLTNVIIPLTGPIIVLILLLATNIVREWRQMGRDFKPNEWGFATTNVVLDIGIGRPLHLDGVRCEVTRTLEQPPVARTAETVLSGIYEPGSAWPLAYFNYPSSFKPSDGSTPDTDETCHAQWFIRAPGRNDWIPVGPRCEFVFGRFQVVGPGRYR